MTTRTERLKALHRDADRLQAEMEQLKNPRGDELVDEAVQEHVKNFDVPYAVALKVTLDENPELKKAYLNTFSVRTTARRT